MLSQFSSEAKTSRLRRLIATLEREAGAVFARTRPDDDRWALRRLREALAQVSALLALGPEPEVRDCPTCGHVVRREATRCGHCWTALSPAPRAASSEPIPERDSEAIWEEEGGRQLQLQGRERLH